jgi:cold shock CspA family protein
MSEPTQQTTIDAKADEPELGTVVSYNGRYGFVRPDRGGPDVYINKLQLRGNIELLKIGTRLVFEVRKATRGRKPWAARIRLAE